MKLTDATGAAISGAEVTVTFSMPAMPQMGMAAMRMSSTLNDKGKGIYEGNGVLESGGTWQVSVVVRHGGQVLGTKQFSVNAEGGM